MLKKYIPYICIFLSAVMWVLCFDPFGIDELAWVFLVPILIAQRNSAITKKRFFGLFFVCALVWLAILIWLRHVYPPMGYVGLLLLPTAVAAFYAPWFLLIPKFFAKTTDSFYKRIFLMISAASLWTTLEFLRSFMFTGFPWCFIAHSQYKKIALIQSASIGGIYLVSFIIILLNLGLANYILHIWHYHKSKISNQKIVSKFCVEFYFAIIVFLANLLFFVYHMPKANDYEYAFRAGSIQTNFVGFEKWDKEIIERNFEIISSLSLGLKEANVNLILWPEAATPPKFPMIGSDYTPIFAKDIAQNTNADMLIGNMAMIEKDDNYFWKNSVFFISKKTGLAEEYYSKIHLVPFGEYLPFWCKFLKKVVPIGNMLEGDFHKPLNVQIASKDYKAGAMICYEDAFPELGRLMSAKDSDFLFVCTNDSWYGEEGGAYQHASHSAFQAIANRKVLLRSSNNGMSCAFNEHGQMFSTITLRDVDDKIWQGKTKIKRPLDVKNEQGVLLHPYTLKTLRPAPMLDDKDSIYFRGAGYTDIYFNKNFKNTKSFYTLYGFFVPYVFAFVSLIFLFSLAKARFISKKA